MTARLYFPPEEYEARWDRVSNEMARQGDVALVWSRSAGGHERFGDVFYLTHYYSNQSGQADEDAWLGVGFAALILEVGQTPKLIADLPEFPQDQVATDRIVRSDEPDRVRLVTEALRARGLTDGRIALVGGRVPSVEIRADPPGPTPRRRACRIRMSEVSVSSRTSSCTSAATNSYPNSSRVVVKRLAIWTTAAANTPATSSIAAACSMPGDTRTKGRPHLAVAAVG
jgi:hypothetical protein